MGDLYNTLKKGNNMTLVIKNVKQEFVKNFKDLASEIHADIEICESRQGIESELEYTENGYPKEFEKQILQDMQEAEMQRKSGTLKTYNSVKEAFESEGII